MQFGLTTICEHSYGWCRATQCLTRAKVVGSILTGITVNMVTMSFIERFNHDETFYFVCWYFLFFNGLKPRFLGEGFELIVPSLMGCMSSLQTSKSQFLLQLLAFFPFLTSYVVLDGDLSSSHLPLGQTRVKSCRSLPYKIYIDTSENDK